ncbi:MAG: hypothetical protein ACI4LC_02165 [Emergencia sp.]
MKLPIKTRILELALQKSDSFSADELAEVLKEEYRGEKTCETEMVEKTINTFCGVGVMKATDFSIDEEKKLNIRYIVTDFGRGYEKMIPGHE